MTPSLHEAAALARSRGGGVLHEEVGVGTQPVDVGEVGEDLDLGLETKAPSRDGRSVEAAIVGDQPVGCTRAELATAPPRHPARVLRSGEDDPRSLGEQKVALSIGNTRNPRLWVKALREHGRDGGMAAGDMREQGRELEPERPTIEPVVHPERCTLAIANSGPSEKPIEGENKSNEPIYKGGARGGIP